AEGAIAQSEMLRTFNCGVGMVVIAAEKDASKVIAAFAAAGESAFALGKVVRAAAEPRVVYDGTLDLGGRMIRKRVAVLISGRGSNMAALIEAAKDKSYPAEIALVVSNVPGAGGLQRAKTAGIATDVVDHTAFGKDRAAFERALQ